MHAVVLLVVTETFILSTSLFCSQSVVGHAYSNEKYRKGEQVALCRGLCQSGAFYMNGIPVAVILSFVVHLIAKGLWIGIFYSWVNCTIYHPFPRNLFL